VFVQLYIFNSLLLLVKLCMTSRLTWSDLCKMEDNNLIHREYWKGSL